MWETFQSTPLGRLSMRKYLRFATAFLAACFLYIFFTAPTTYAAADATWKGDAIVYDGNEYKKSGVSKGTEGHKIPEGAQLYIYSKVTDIVSNAQIKAYVIYFAPGNDPGTAKTATYQSFDFKRDDNFTNPSAKKTISIDPSGASATTAGTTSCAVEGIGWVVCPVTKFLAKGMDFVYSLVDGFLEVKPLQTTDNQAMYRAWSFMRNIANIAFVIAFLIIIYSQITNFGLNNYDVKKMLPRIVIAAVLVNTSYWICAVAIDVFNILGYSIQDIFISIRNSLVGTEGNSWDVVSWESMSSFVLSGGSVVGAAGVAGFLGITGAGLVVAGAGISGLIFLLLPMLLSVLFVILMTFLILAARQAIITILVILAPLAFVAYLLPNTEKWFEKWRSALFTLLLLFPAFSVVFGGSQLAAAAIIQNATSLNIILLGMAVQVAPLAITPLLLKLGGGVLNRFVGVVNNPAKGLFDRGKNWANERTEQNKAAGHAALAERARRQGFINGRPTSGNRRQRSRFNPYNMAYNREYNRREREGMKTANEGVSEGHFDNTEAGTRIYRRSQEGSILKHSAESANSRSFQRALHDANAIHLDPENQRLFELRGLHHQAHVDKGISGVYTEAMDNHAEFDLQNQIARNVNGIGNIKVHADVNAGLAEGKKKLVASQGQLALKQMIQGDRALSHEVMMTTRFEKQAAEYDTIVQKAAEASYDDYSRTNPAAQALRLQSNLATKQAGFAEDRVNRMLEDAVDKGYGSQLVDPGNSLLAYELQAIADSQVAEKKAVEAIQASAQSQSEKRFITSAGGRRLNTAAQAAKDSLEAATAEEAALVQERRTEKGAEGLTGEDKRTADELREADIQKRAQTQRTAAATSQANQEYASQVTSDAVIPGGTDPIATVAGGIAGQTGISQAKATATQTTFKAFDEAVGAEKTLVSRNTPADILAEDIPNPNDPNAPTSIGLGNANILDEPEERIAALAGQVAGDSHHASQIKLWQRMGELRQQAQAELATAEASGDQPAINKAKDRIGKVKSLEQQAFGDRKKTPFGVGDVDLGKAKVGQYDNDIYESTRARLHTNMSAQTLATMDPDDIRLIFEMARAGKLSNDEVSMVNSAYTAWEKDDNLKASIQPKHRDLLGPIRDHAESGTPSYPQPDNGFWDDRYDAVRHMSNPR